MAAMNRNSLRIFYLRALSDEDPVTAQYYFQKMQEFDEALRLYGPAAAKATLPKIRIRRAGGRLALMRKYLDALKAGNDGLAQRIQRRIAARDKSGLTDSVDAPAEVLMGDIPMSFFRAKDLPAHVAAEYRNRMSGRRSR